MDEKQKQTAAHDTARRQAAKSHLRRALVGMAKARSEARRHAEASQGALGTASESSTSSRSRSRLTGPLSS